MTADREAYQTWRREGYGDILDRPYGSAVVRQPLGEWDSLAEALQEAATYVFCEVSTIPWTPYVDCTTIEAP